MKRMCIICTAIAAIVTFTATDAFAQARLRNFGGLRPNNRIFPPSVPGGKQANDIWRFQHGFPQQQFQQQQFLRSPLLRRGDVDDFIEDSLRRRFGRRIRGVDCDFRNGCFDVGICTNDYNDFLAARSYLSGLPQLAGYRINPYCDDLEDHIENKIERFLGRAVDDVDVDVDHRRRRIEIEVELRFRGAYADLNRLLASMPELAGYYVDLDVDFDD